MKTFSYAVVFFGVLHSSSVFAGVTRTCPETRVGLNLTTPSEPDFADGLTVNAGGASVVMKSSDGVEYFIQPTRDAGKPSLCIYSSEKSGFCVRDRAADPSRDKIEFPIQGASGKVSAVVLFDKETQQFSLVEKKEPRRSIEFSFEEKPTAEDPYFHTQVMKISRKGGASLRLQLTGKGMSESLPAQEWGGFPKGVSVDLSQPHRQYETQFSGKPCETKIVDTTGLPRQLEPIGGGKPPVSRAAVITMHENPYPSLPTRRERRLQRRGKR